MTYEKPKLTIFPHEFITDSLIRIEGFIYPLAIIQELFEVLHIPFKSVLMFGPPGGGKTHIARRVFPVLMRKIFGDNRKVISSYNNLGDFAHNPSEFKYYPTLTNNTMHYEKSELVKINEKSITNDFIINNIFDEVSRISNEAQNQLLPVCEDNDSRSFLLGHLGEIIPIKKENVNVLLMNPGGAGTIQLNEALFDRTAIVEVPAPDLKFLNLLFAPESEGSFNSNYIKNETALIYPVCRKVSDYQIGIVLKELKRFNLSIRQFREIFWYLQNSPYPQHRLTSFIMRRIDLNLIDTGRSTREEIRDSFIPTMFHKLNQYVFI